MEAIHAIVDNYAIHKHPRCANGWLGIPAGFHFNSNSASWLNAVEGFSAKLTCGHLKRGVFRSAVGLQTAINRFVVEKSTDPKPIVWTTDPEGVLTAVKREKQMLKSLHYVHCVD